MIVLPWKKKAIEKEMIRAVTNQFGQKIDSYDYQHKKKNILYYFIVLADGMIVHAEVGLKKGSTSCTFSFSAQ